MSTTRRSNPDGTVNVCSWCQKPTGGHDYDCPKFVLYVSRPVEFCAGDDGEGSDELRANEVTPAPQSSNDATGCADDMEACRHGNDARDCEDCAEAYWLEKDAERYL